MTGKIFPFLWHHGESKEEILEEIKKIQSCGIDSICVESRPHPDFCGKGWWEDFGYILRECKNRNMKVWLLDECHYPTGCANQLSFRRPDLQPLNITATHMNVMGEEKNAKIILKDYGIEEDFICALAFPVRNGKIVYEEGTEVSEYVHDDILYWNVPKGNHRIIAMYTSHKCSEWKFLDMMRSEATEYMIKEIYQPHYEHFSEYFGETFVGFFSDEPRLANGIVSPGIVRAPYKYRGLGVFGVTYPWKTSIIKDLEIRDKRLLYALWAEPWNKEAADFRVKYMHYVTEQYAKNFSDLLGDWCEAHGVLYSGHIIEDEGAHTRTTCSTGHFFKSMRGQHIAGVDIVYNQVKVKFGDEAKTFVGIKDNISDFYNYTLAKLASSAARLEKRKAGRALCEIFGAFGWGESIQEMKYLIDFMIVRGINHFIPHAFNAKIDDDDSPPYFYNGGNNPQFSSFRTLMKYTNTLCSYFNDGKADVRVAVLYHAEAEWSGLRYTPVDVLCRWLTRKQIEFDIVPEYEIRRIDEYGVHTDNCRYDVLLASDCEYISEKILKLTEKQQNRYYMIKTENELENLPVERLYRLEDENPNLRIYRYEKETGVLYFIFNESAEVCSNRLLLSETGYYLIEDVQGAAAESGKIENGIGFSLAAGESKVIHIKQKSLEEYHSEVVEEVVLKPVWHIEIADGDSENWAYYKTTDKNIDIADWKEIPDFSGKIRFTATINIKKIDLAFLLFKLSYVGLSVKLNGRKLGERIGEPYRLDVSNYIKSGENKLEVILTTTLGLKKRDRYSHYSAIGKYGFCDYIKLCYYTIDAKNKKKGKEL